MNLSGYDPYSPKVGEQYEYHEAGNRAIVTVIEDLSTETEKSWKIHVNQLNSADREGE